MPTEVTLQRRYSVYGGENAKADEWHTYSELVRACGHTLDLTIRTIRKYSRYECEGHIRVWTVVGWQNLMNLHGLDLPVLAQKCKDAGTCREDFFSEDRDAVVNLAFAILGVPAEVAPKHRTSRRIRIAEG